MGELPAGCNLRSSWLDATKTYTLFLQTTWMQNILYDWLLSWSMHTPRNTKLQYNHFHCTLASFLVLQRCHFYNTSVVLCAQQRILCAWRCRNVITHQLRSDKDVLSPRLNYWMSCKIRFIFHSVVLLPESSRFHWLRSTSTHQKQVASCNTDQPPDTLLIYLIMCYFYSRATSLCSLPLVQRPPLCVSL